MSAAPFGPFVLQCLPLLRAEHVCTGKNLRGREKCELKRSEEW